MILSVAASLKSRAIIRGIKSSSTTGSAPFRRRLRDPFRVNSGIERELRCLCDNRYMRRNQRLVNPLSTAPPRRSHQRKASRIRRDDFLHFRERLFAAGHYDERTAFDTSGPPKPASSQSIPHASRRRAANLRDASG